MKSSARDYNLPYACRGSPKALRSLFVSRCGGVEIGSGDGEGDGKDTGHFRLLEKDVVRGKMSLHSGVPKRVGSRVDSIVGLSMVSPLLFFSAVD